MTADADIRAAMISALAWQAELGATEAIGETPCDRFAESAPKANPKSEASQERNAASVTTMPAATEVEPRAGPAPTPPGTDALAAGATTLEALAEAMRAWDGSPLREAARNFVFCDGLPGAHLMVIGEAPGAEEDRQGKPFVGRAGQLLDRMLDAIGLSRNADEPGKAVYITNILPWRPPGNRTPSEQEAQAFLPFVERHIALAKPRVILTMGNTPTKAILRTQTGIKRMRGSWTNHKGTDLPLMATFHPAYLLRQPADKRLAWFDLIAVAKKLEV